MGFIDKLNWRYATKKFSDTPVSSENLDKIIEAIRMAPSAIGMQPYRIILARGETKDKLIESSGQLGKKPAPYLFVFCSRVDYPAWGEAFLDNVAKTQGKTREEIVGLEHSVNKVYTEKSREALRIWAERQVYIALGFGLAACAELEVDACPMEGFKPDDFSQILGLHDYMHPVAIMAVGYRDPSDPARPEVRPKVRFSKDDLFEFR